jgi:hypothetical protein
MTSSTIFDHRADARGLGSPGWIPWAGYALAALPVVLAIPQVLRPSPWLTSALLLCPLAVLALALYAPAAFEVTQRRTKRRSINVLLGFSVLPLYLANLYHAQINPWWPLVPAGLAAVAVLAAVWGAKERAPLAAPRAFLVFVTLFAAAYGYGAVAVADVQLDASPGRLTPVLVISKYETYGRHGTRYDHLRVPAWGPAPAGAVDVTRSVYDGVAIGDRVCMTLHPGLLALPWFTTGLCPPGTVAPSA